MAWLWKECLYWKSDEFNQSYDSWFGCIYYLQDEKYMAGAYCQQLEGERGGAMTQVLEEDSTPKSVSHIHRLFRKSYCWLLHLLFIRCYQCLNAQSYSRPETCVWFQSLDNRRLLHVPSTRWFYINYIRVQRLVKIKILTAFFETPGAQL